ncbi:hypothetical protein RD792_002103 [Penstemon davidsonii]|uniref:Uncharacterized protein n=1 Tax=Penstemon davidsonii TaxID=160366 RepID=A0ABR0DQ42_9LAMI|nr:hypothetical protein RD792_002103 [Penstemon davidsonii]
MEEVLQLNVTSVVEDVLQQHGKRLSDIDLASRKAEEASLRRYEAAGWLRKMVGVLGGKDFPAQPSEEEFRLWLRSGITLCNVLNKVQPGAVSKVVEAPSDAVIIPDGAALSAYQYFENIRNFLDALEQLGVPAFEASDLEQGGKSSRIVNCILALRSYNDWKEGGGNGVWKFGGSSKPPSAGKQFVRRNSDLFMNSISRNSSMGERSFCSFSSGELEEDLNEMGTSNSLRVLVRELLTDKKREDIPLIMENMLSKVMEEFEHRLAIHNEQVRNIPREDGVLGSNEPLPTDTPSEIEASNITKHNSGTENDTFNGESRHQHLVEHQQRSVQDLKHTLLSAKEDMQMLQIKYQEEVNNLGKHLHSLAHAASGYQKVQEENRKLYNQVQDLKGNIRVYCRVRPFLSGQPNRTSAVGDIDERTITILTPSKSGKEGKKLFTFNKVFGPASSQEEVFADTQPLIRSVLDGYNVCIFAYGQTGSGKTHTMTGPAELTKESVGVNYRALSDLFLISEQRKNTCSYDISNGFNVPNANLVPVTSTSDVIYLMNLGHKNRAASSTSMNDRSSRSHSCLTVHVQGKDLTCGTVLRGCMHLVDLAGSERVDKSEVVGDRLKEAQHINKSLSALGDVIFSLAQKHPHVPYRNSKLTQLLQDSLGGQAKTLMFVHISPQPDAVGETISTLKFAERVSTIELGAAKSNKDSSDVKELKEQIASLKAALARKEGGEVEETERVRVVMSSESSPAHSSSLTSRRQSLDNQQLSMTSPPWPISMEDDEVFNKSRRHSLDNGLARTQYEAVVDDLDELEAATSDSSELDYQWQLNVPRSNSMPNGVGIKVKRPSPKQKKGPELRSQIPSPTTRRVSNGIRTPLHTKLGRQPATIDVRRKPASGK